MRYSVVTIGLLMVLANAGQPVRLEIRDFSEAEPPAALARRLKWPRRTIEVAFSNSLLSPGTHIKPGSDVVGAARRALSRWSNASGLNFAVTWSNRDSVSPADSGDGVSLITVAYSPENEAFNAETTTGRTRVFYEPETGNIQEADISINPRPRSPEGADLQFSTDGTPGTYDLEATFTHEIGHLLGLEHSHVLSSTMQSHQAYNGTFGLPAFSERTLSEEDRQRVRALYGPKQRVGKIEGRLFNVNGASLSAIPAMHVWAESITTGRVVTSDTTADDGSYSLGELPAGSYRVVAGSVEKDSSTSFLTTAVDSGQKRFTVEIGNQINVKVDSVTKLNFNLLPAQAAATKLNPRLLGLNGDLSVVALPLEPGRKFKIYLSGEGVDNVPGASISITSPYFSVDASSLTREQWHTGSPVVSFDVSVRANTPFGDYTLRLQSNAGEIAYVPGALTIDPGAATASANPINDPRFFITQQYKDISGRAPTQETLDSLISEFDSCNSRPECLRARKLDLSRALFLNEESFETGAFIYSIYNVALGRRPTFSEFEEATGVISKSETTDANRLAAALSLTERPEFQQKFLKLVSATQYVDALIVSANQTAEVGLEGERPSLLGFYDGSAEGRARILLRVSSHSGLLEARYNQTLVLLQYFAFLRRDPDNREFDSWVNVLNNKPLRDPSAAKSLTCSFLNSSEYQSRFAMVATHNANQCN